MNFTDCEVEMQCSNWKSDRHLFRKWRLSSEGFNEELSNGGSRTESQIETLNWQSSAILGIQKNWFLTWELPVEIVNKRTQTNSPSCTRRLARSLLVSYKLQRLCSEVVLWVCNWKKNQKTRILWRTLCREKVSKYQSSNLVLAPGWIGSSRCETKFFIFLQSIGARDSG